MSQSEIEAWLIGDRDRFANYFGVPANRIAANPEDLQDPKGAVINLVRRSRMRDVRSDMLPIDPASQAVGPGYSTRIIQYASDIQRGWRPDPAAEACDSLSRALKCLRRIVRGS